MYGYHEGDKSKPVELKKRFFVDNTTNFNAELALKGDDDWLRCAQKKRGASLVPPLWPSCWSPVVVPD
jgi:hypothetical protein